MTTAPAESLPTDWLRPLGSTGLTVSAVTAGGGPIGSMPGLFGYDVPAERGIDLVARLLRSPIVTIDTANGYSDGESERRIGAGIRRIGGLPAGHWIATKVDGRDGDYSAERVRRSIEESAERLGVDQFPLVYLHDPEFAADQGIDSPGGAIDELVALQREGVIGHLGVAGGDVRVMEHYLDLNVFEVVLTHNRYTLLDRSADRLIDKASSEGVGVVNAAYLGGGILARPGTATTYGYRPVTPATKNAALALESLCQQYAIDLATAALQFSLRDPRIATSVVGFSRPERLPAILDAAGRVLPADFWERAEELLPDPANWLNPPDSLPRPAR